MALFINAGQMRNERRKKEKALKKKARIMTRTTRTKRADLQQLCNRSLLTKTDQLQTTLSSAESVFSLLQTLSLNTLRDVKTADAKQTNNRSVD